MEAASGLEPLNQGFADLSLSHLGTPPQNAETIKKVPGGTRVQKNKKIGAGNEIRTRDVNLGKVALYH